MTATEMSAQDWESFWWRTVNFHTYSEETKQITYANRMGLEALGVDGKWPVYDLAGATVLDLGGGPVSMLLKCINGNSVVVDPCEFPDWVRARYEHAEIDWRQEPAETYRHPEGRIFAEAWQYNVAQHVVDPEAIIDTARRHARILRIFEWIETETNVGHPHKLHADKLNRWIGNGANGTVEMMNENGCVGLAYHGVFAL